MLLKRIVATIVAGLSCAMLRQPLPRFEDYTVPRERIRPVAVELASAPDARKYRTVIRDAASRGPNFAGHFTVAQWGCGSPCKTFAIISARTGHVWMPAMWVGLGVSVRPDSRLLVVDGPEFWSDAWASGPPGAPADMPLFAYYFVWRNEQLQLIDSTRVIRPSR